jgi:hypothetical protein
VHLSPRDDAIRTPDLTTSFNAATAASFIGIYGISAASVRPDVGGPDHLAPLLGFVDYQLAKLGRRSRQRRAAEVGKPRLNFGVCKSGVDLRVKLVDDLGRRGLRCAEAVPNTPLVAREPTSPLNGVVFDLRYSFFLFDQIVIAVTDSLSVPP